MTMASERRSHGRMPCSSPNGFREDEVISALGLVPQCEVVKELSRRVGRKFWSPRASTARRKPSTPRRAYGGGSAGGGDANLGTVTAIHPLESASKRRNDRSAMRAVGGISSR